MYKWVDEKGGTVYSNIRPAKTRSVSNLEVVVEDERIADERAAETASRREQELLDRISRLERQLQAPRYQAPLPLPPPPPDYYPSSYYPAPYYPAYYPFAPAFSYVAASRRLVAPSRFTSGRVSSFHRAGASRGRR
jgi:hypothetical protein